jgi:hypothetical protein
MDADEFYLLEQLEYAIKEIEKNKWEATICR